MPVIHRGTLFLAALLSCLVLVARPAAAQQYEFNQGFDAKLGAIASGEELSNQPNLFVMEVEFRPMGLIEVELTDPASGKKTKELVWYKVYRTRNRQLDAPVDNSDTTPVNPEDPIPSPMFIPVFTLVVDDENDLKIYRDQILPEAVTAIERREKLKLSNSVDVITPIPEAAPSDDESAPWIYGVATWKGVDPKTDRFRVFAEGFSNGYRAAQLPGDEQVIERKTFVLTFWRPGDGYDQTDDEIRRDPKDPLPRWIYRPDGGAFTAPAAAPAEQAAAEAADQN